ncbi:MAG: tetratricopeptide repeat protein [Planctomycetota bacterium]
MVGAGLVLPLLCLAALEGALRLTGYGYPTAFLLRDGRFLTSNLRFGWRFFPRSISREPVPLRLPAVKPADTYRIFVLGSSAARGFPDPAFGLARFLEVMLREAFPGARFEVANTAMTAINSHVILPIARDCARHDPDLFVVYLGNNEVVGPFGPGTSLLGYQPSRTVIRASLWLRTTRVGQLLFDFIALLRGASEPHYWTGMEMFAQNRVTAGDPRLVRTREHLEANLTGICAAARGRGADVLLCTVPVNLRDCAPFASVHCGTSADAPGTEASGGGKRGEWEQGLARGIECENRGDLEGAIREYRACLASDSGYAELHFRLAGCLLARERVDEARGHFALAREHDALRYRADAAVNEAIRRVAREWQGQGVDLVDVEQAFAESSRSPGGIPGEGLFYEHVHPSFEGTYELASVVFRCLVTRLPETLARKGVVPLEPPSLARCEEQLAFTDWDRQRILNAIWAVIQRAPFTYRFDHAGLSARYLQRRERLWESSRSLADCRAAYERAATASPDDPWLCHGLATLALATRDHGSAMRYYERLRELVPNDRQVFLGLGRSALALQDPAGAERFFAEYLELESWQGSAYRSVAQICGSDGMLSEAESWCRRGLAREPGNVGLLSLLGEALIQKRELEEARRLLERAVAEEATYAPAWHGLGTVWLAEGDPARALAPLSRAIELDPEMGRAHAALGGAFLRLGERERALESFGRAVVLEPDNVQALEARARLLRQDGNLRAALGLCERILKVQPDHTAGAVQLAWILATISDPALRDAARARALAEAAVRRTQGQWPDALISLAAAHAAAAEFERAIEVAGRAKALAEQAGRAVLAREAAGHLQHYYRRRPILLEPERGAAPR